MAGALPPSSSETFVTFSEAARITSTPPSTLPVKLTMPTFGFEASAWPTTVPEPKTRLNTPLGRLDLATSSANLKAFTGVSQLGLITMVFPVTSAGAILRAIRKNGKFQGRIPAITPIGILKSRMFSLGRSLWITSPMYRRAKFSHVIKVRRSKIHFDFGKRKNFALLFAQCVRDVIDVSSHQIRDLVQISCTLDGWTLCPAFLRSLRG